MTGTGDGPRVGLSWVLVGTLRRPTPIQTGRAGEVSVLPVGIRTLGVSVIPTGLTVPATLKRLRGVETRDGPSGG